jgi:hypothetical protein
MNTKKLLYGGIMLLIFWGAGVFWTAVPLTAVFPAITSTAFHFNGGPVSWRLIIDVLLWLLLAWFYWISCRNFLVGIEAQHSTLVKKR